MRQVGTEMGRAMTADGTADRPRIDWVDYAKGFCIVFVVMMHSTLGVEHALGQEGWLGKVVDFVYFYLLWTAIQFAFKAPMLIHEHGPLSTVWLYVESFWEPFGTLWFIYLLPIFFVVTKLAHDLRLPAPIIWLAAALLEIA